MKRLLIFFVAAFILIASSPSAMAYDSSSSDSSSGSGSSSSGETGTFMDYLSLGSTSCSSSSTSSSTSTCSEDSSNGFFAAVACKVMKAFNTGVTPLYCNIVTNDNYLAAVNAALMLYVVLTAFSFIFGLIPMTSGNLVTKLFKAIVVYSIIINADIYFSLVYNNVLETTQQMVKILLNSSTATSSSGTGSSNFFEYVDKGMYKIFNSTADSKGYSGSGQTYDKTNLKIMVMGFAIWQLGGDMVGWLFFAVVIGWIINYFSIMIRYLLAMLSMMFLLMLGPIFIPTLLFEKSRNMGEEWISMILSFMIQIVLVIAFVLMVQGFFIDFYNTIKSGLESSATLTDSPSKTLKVFNTDSSTNGGAYKVENSTSEVGSSTKASEDYFTNIFGGSSASKMPAMILKLIKTMFILYCASAFMLVVPSLAAFLVGKMRFVRMFQGMQFGRGDKTTQANLMGQGAGKAPNMFDWQAGAEGRELTKGTGE